jgi:hypothetical protein
MNYPQCRQPMMLVGRYWMCGEHAPPVTIPFDQPDVESAPAGQSDQFTRLPSLPAITLREFQEEKQSVTRLHRFCDVVEILTRFCTITALGELRYVAQQN